MSVTEQSTVSITVNGETREIAAQHIDAMLRELGYEGNHYAVAVNFDVVPRSRWSETAIKSGDEIEILTARQGG